MNAEKLILLGKGHQAIYNASRCEYRNRDYIASLWVETVLEMGVGKWRALVFFAYFDDNTNSSNTNNSDNVVIRPHISSFNFYKKR
jgi:hypothetical protein